MRVGPLQNHTARFARVVNALCYVSRFRGQGDCRHVNASDCAVLMPRRSPVRRGVRIGVHGSRARVEVRLARLNRDRQWPPPQSSWSKSKGITRGEHATLVRGRVSALEGKPEAGAIRVPSRNSYRKT